MLFLVPRGVPPFPIVAIGSWLSGFFLDLDFPGLQFLVFELNSRPSFTSSPANNQLFGFIPLPTFCCLLISRPLLNPYFVFHKSAFLPNK